MVKCWWFLHPFEWKWWITMWLHQKLSGDFRPRITICFMEIIFLKRKNASNDNSRAELGLGCLLAETSQLELKGKSPWSVMQFPDHSRSRRNPLTAKNYINITRKRMPGQWWEGEEGKQTINRREMRKYSSGILQFEGKEVMNEAWWGAVCFEMFLRGPGKTQQCCPKPKRDLLAFDSSWFQMEAGSSRKYSKCNL